MKRNVVQIQQQWKTMKMEAKKALSEHRRVIGQTGGGPRPQSPNPEHVVMQGLLPHEFVEDYNIFDSNGGPVSTTYETPNF